MYTFQCIRHRYTTFSYLFYIMFIVQFILRLCMCTVCICEFVYMCIQFFPHTTKLNLNTHQKVCDGWLVNMKHFNVHLISSLGIQCALSVLILHIYSAYATHTYIHTDALTHLQSIS